MVRGAANEEEREEPLTAVLLADSFSTRFRPVTAETPKALLPLVNAPMIEYALEWLASNGVAKVHVLCCAHADAISAHLDRSRKWAPERCAMAINTIHAHGCRSAGDALRFMDQEGLVRDDFVLLSCDSITNMNLGTALAAHAARRASDKAAIMTMVAAGGVDEAQRIQLGLSDLAISMDSATYRLLSYLPLAMRNNDATMVDVDTTSFSERDKLSLRYDLADCGIYICAPEVLMLFSDNFDFQHIQRDFVHGILSEEELGNKLFVHELCGEYGAMLSNLRAYAAISRDILMRWLYPLTPDSNLLPPAAGEPGASSDFFFSPPCTYKEPSVVCSSTARLHSAVCVAANTTIEERAHISASVIGSGCRIDAEAVVRNSYVMSGVRIRRGAMVTDSMICDGALIGEGCNVTGAVIGPGCVIASGHTTPPNARITLCTLRSSGGGGAEGDVAGSRSLDDVESDDGDDDTALQRPTDAILQAAHAARATGTPPPKLFDAAAVGAAGAGFDHHAQRGYGVTDAERLTAIVLPSVELVQARATILANASDTASSGDEDEAGGGAAAEAVAARGDGSDPDRLFKTEVEETLLRTMQLARDSQQAMQDMTQNAVIELNGLKIAEVRTFADCARYVLTTLMDLQAPPQPGVLPRYRSLFAAAPPDLESAAGKQALWAGFRKALATWAPTLRKFLHGDDDQFELLLTLEEYASGKGLFSGAAAPGGRMYMPIFSNVLFELWNQDILAEQVAREWREAKQEDEAEDQECLEAAAEFFEHLDQSSEDDSDDDSDASDSTEEEEEEEE